MKQSLWNEDDLIAVYRLKNFLKIEFDSFMALHFRRLK